MARPKEVRCEREAGGGKVELDLSLQVQERNFVLAVGAEER